MNTVRLLLKAFLIVVYLLGLWQLVEPNSFGIPFWTLWVAVALWIAHLGEYLFLRRRFAGLAGSALHHFCQTLLFGFLHWLPLLRRPNSN
ncbi:hypothetical protein DV711_01870 [Motiliproteus coralliicola]|uniref:DUF1145 domain-containing protein n=1 Tax=Motiliproteus coralliicola TaxID=2283196 RepID=A0A369WTH5_9GAMM|nr:hypothetical protein [Motiliproteus coralliicola]RDE24359.1 hypothetical protein DV711_01870 [Motiliproteus coralliicola]